MYSSWFYPVNGGTLVNASRFALNRIACPGLGLEPFLRLSRSAGLANSTARLNELP